MYTCVCVCVCVCSCICAAARVREIALNVTVVIPLKKSVWMENKAMMLCPTVQIKKLLQMKVLAAVCSDLCDN